MSDNRPEEPSAYVFRWGIYSWVCVAIGVAFAVMWSMEASLVPGIIIGVLIAVVGGIAFAFTPRAALARREQPMTPKARRKAAQASAGRKRAANGDKAGKADGGA